MSAAVIGDLTSLYFAARSNGGIDYVQLDSYLKDCARVKSWDFNMWYTLFDPKNREQKKFIKFLRDELNWNIHTGLVQDLVVGESSTKYNFDAPICFTLGRVSHKVDKLIVVSGSYHIAESLLELNERGKRVSVAFYNDLMDPRWVRRLFYNERAEFIDLHEINGEQYDPPRTEMKRIP